MDRKFEMNTFMYYILCTYNLAHNLNSKSDILIQFELCAKQVNKHMWCESIWMHLHRLFKLSDACYKI